MKSENIIFNYRSGQIEYMTSETEVLPAANGDRIIISYSCRVKGNDVTVTRGESRMNGVTPRYEVETFHNVVPSAKKRGLDRLLRTLEHYEFHADTYSKRDEYREIISLLSQVSPAKMRQVQIHARARRKEIEKTVVSIINYKRGIYGKNKTL